MAQAQGQITIIDYNDAVTLTGFINSNHPRTQMFNPDNGTYTPSWASSSLVLTPSMQKLGATTEMIGTAAITKVEWFIGANATKITNGGGYTVGALGTPTLTVASNVMAGLPGIDYRCEVTYHDAGGAGTYDWTKYTNAGTLDTGWGAAGHKSGKSILVDGVDVDVKATFYVMATI